MNCSLLVLAGWLSTSLAPLEPSKYPTPEKVPTPEQQVPQSRPAKIPAVTRPPKLSFRPGSYSLESLKLPAVEKIENFEGWQQGPAWPVIEDAVVVLTDDVADPQRFVAYLVDPKAQRIAAIRSGDKARHLLTIGQMGAVEKPPKEYSESVPPSIMTLAGSGAVIILRPPPPPGPNGQPDDLVRRILDAGAVAGVAAQQIGDARQIGRGGLG